MNYGPDCGGAYIKLLTQPPNNKKFNPSHFNANTPYTIMFGPDKCRDETDKVCAAIFLPRD
jgi:hypothetical protein